MECSQLTERAVERLTGQASAEQTRELALHLEACASCRSEFAPLERAWEFLGEDTGLEASPEFLDRSRELLEDEMLRARVRQFRPRSRRRRWLAQAAALLLAAGLGYLAATRKPRAEVPPQPAGKGAAMPELGSNPRLSNLSYERPGSEGRIGIAFDVTTRHTVEGPPSDPEVAKLLAYLVSHNAENAGEKSRAIELVQQHYGAGDGPASPDIVAALTGTLRKDPNPGVRKKAADALAGMRMTSEIRTAFLDALRDDRNPAVRLVAIESLSAAAKESPDPRTIQSLREKAVDPSENGFVRAKAASALKTMEF
ncbi:MAG TPA: HEAT repeat domain-containing protein [Thermoanaerobaculia bacterium]|nr:HEAT repeat domain-containing protein [Thermoanaerobaculia bacterium]